MNIVALTEENDPTGAFENEALDLIEGTGINAAEHETHIIACLTDPLDTVAGALYYGSRPGAEIPEVTFTVFVQEDHRRRGIATELVNELVYMRRFGQLDPTYVQLRAWVVSDHMRTLLEDLDFDEDGRDHMVMC